MIAGQQNSNDAGGTPAIVFTGCNMLDAAAEQHAMGAADGAAPTPKASAKRREVSVGGRRVKTIDVHAHCVIPEALALQGKNLDDQRGPGIGEVGARRIAEMDEQGVDIEALSINPHWYKAPRDLAAEIVKINNERLAEYCATYPERFVAFASVALQFPELAVEQLEHAVKKLGLRG
ncbi:MAG: aminocarboxymuconate-semialdehyde decarboxylase, partial [Betaproteobacteria bacterium]|nr:aminocarboxymuconate-semialdehyde decarboxylase [Betaproteobacteria bacterium]